MGGVSLPRCFWAKTRKWGSEEARGRGNRGIGEAGSCFLLPIMLHLSESQINADLRIARIKDKETHHLWEGHPCPDASCGRSKHLWEGHLPIQPAPMYRGGSSAKPGPAPILQR